jgi:hypothetical protein
MCGVASGVQPQQVPIVAAGRCVNWTFAKRSVLRVYAADRIILGRIMSMSMPPSAIQLIKAYCGSKRNVREQSVITGGCR